MSAGTAERHFLESMMSYHQGLGKRVPMESGLFKSMREARELFAAQGLPSRESEEWAPTSLARWEGTFAPWPLVRVVQKSELKDLFPEGASSVVFLNGQYSQLLSNLPEGVEVKSLGPEDKSPQGPVHDGLEALNLGLLNEIVEVRIRGVLRAPLCLVHVNTEDTDGHLTQSRVHVHVAKGAQAAMLEVFATFAEEAPRDFSNDVTELCLEEGTNVEYVRVQRRGKNSRHIHRVRAHLGRDAVLSAFGLTQGSHLSRLDVDLHVDREGAQANFTGLSLTKGIQEASHHIDIHHHVGHTTSRQLFKAIADGESVGVFYGTIHVDKGANQVDAEQLCKNLLLSPKARVYAWPRIRAATDDIKCGHGAAIGQLNPEERFYLESRAIDPTQVQKMLLHGFVKDALDRVQNTSLKNKVEEFLRA